MIGLETDSALSLSFAAHGSRMTNDHAPMTTQIQYPKSNIQNWIVYFCVTLLAGPAYAQPDPSPPEMREDAELTAVTFINADRGWAVGDRGVIWQTNDGGRSWKQQSSGVTCRLEAVQ